MNVQERERATQYRVGIFVVISLVAFLGTIYLLGARARLFEVRYTIHADFTEVGGLVEGATVRLAGVQIGRVSGVRLPGQPGGKVRVDMSIARQFSDRVRKDSVARIDTQGLLGDKIIEITVGTAAAPAVHSGDVIASRDPTDVGQIMSQAATTVKNVSALTESVRSLAESLDRSKIVDQVSGTLTSAQRAIDQIARDSNGVLTEARKVTTRVGRIVDQVETGPGWAHVLLYEEPEALRRLNNLIATTQTLLERVERGEGALGVMTSKESTVAAQRLLTVMDRLGRMADRPDSGEGLLPGLLFDPKYRAVLDDLQVVAHNLRDVSDRVAGGRGTLGGLVRDEPADGNIRQASQDLQATLANLKEITEKINEGEGTLGALIADPTIYERLVGILEGTQRSFLLRMLLRGLGSKGKDGLRDGSTAAPRDERAR